MCGACELCGFPVVRGACEVCGDVLCVGHA